jgi:hypothetical protein
MNANLKTAFAVMAVILAPSAGRAALSAQDTFETYSTGALAGQGAGTGWGASWTTPAGIANVLDTTSSPLTYSVPGGGVINGGTRAVQSAATAVNSAQVTESRQLASSISGNDVFVSFVMRYSGSATVDATDTFSFHLSGGATSTANTLNFGARGANFMARSGTGTPLSGDSFSQSYTAGETFLAVGQYVWDGTAYNAINAWLNPAYGDSGTPQLNVTISGGLSSLGYAFFRNYDANSDDVVPNDFWTMDNFVVGTSWADVVPTVVPEPALMALLGLGAFAMLASRRRAK